MDRVVVWTPEALEDMRRVALYSQANHGAKHRARFLSSLRADVRGLIEFPGLGVQYGHGLRRLRHVVHFIYYRATADTITIVRVLHESQDPSLHLPENDG